MLGYTDREVDTLGAATAAIVTMYNYNNGFGHPANVISADRKSPAGSLVVHR